MSAANDPVKREWTQEEREAAAISVVASTWPGMGDVVTNDMASDLQVRHPYTKTAIDLQCQLTAALHEIAEARDLLMLAEFTDSEHLTRYDQWLARNS